VSRSSFRLEVSSPDLFLKYLIYGHPPLVLISVADPGCLSRIPDPYFYPSRIPDPKTATKERGENFVFVIPFNVATNVTKLKIISVLKC
jgi:hypothetical protein